MRTEPYEKVLRDIRIFPIFEGANDVLRAFIALSGLKPLGEKLSGLGEIGLSDPIGSIGVLIDYFGGADPARGAPGPDRQGAPRAQEHADAVSEQVKRLRDVSESLLRKHRERDHRAPVRTEATRRLAGRHLRPDRRALQGHLDLRGPGRRALGPGALHRGDLLHPRRRPRPRPLRPDSSTTTTSGCRRSPSSPTSAASTATRCSRTRATRAGPPLDRLSGPPRRSRRPGAGCRAACAGPRATGRRSAAGARRAGPGSPPAAAGPSAVRTRSLTRRSCSADRRSTSPRSSSRSVIQVTFELSQASCLASSPIGFGSSRACSAIQCGGTRSYSRITAMNRGPLREDDLLEERPGLAGEILPPFGLGALLVVALVTADDDTPSTGHLICSTIECTLYW